DAFNGKEVTRVPTGASFRARFKYPYIIIHRIDLHNVMLDACRRAPLISLVPDTMVSGFSDQGDRVTVTTEDGRSFEGAVLIGADGIRSRTRAQLLGDGDPKALLGMLDLSKRQAVGDRDPIRHWHKGRVVLLGDAAHPTLQSLAQGACM